MIENLAVHRGHIYIFRWIGLMAELISDLVLFFTAVFCVMKKDSMDSGSAGLALSFAFQVQVRTSMYFDLIRHTLTHHFGLSSHRSAYKL